MKYLFILCLLFSSFNLLSQNNIIIKGTYWIGAICKDGIVIGSDTRGNILTNNKELKDTAIAYYDTCQKVFEFKNFAYASSGTAIIGGKFMGYYLKQFEESKYGNCNAVNSIEKLDSFFKSKYPKLEQEFLSLGIITAGYYNNGHPALCALSLQEEKCLVDEGAIGQDEYCRLDKIYKPKYTCKEMANIIEKTIYKIANDYKKKDKIGGPIMIIKISKDNKCTWLKNKPTHKSWDDMSDLYKAYNNKRLHIVFSSKKSEKYFKEKLITGQTLTQ